MILYDFCLLPAQFCYVIVRISKADSRVPWEISIGAKKLVLRKPLKVNAKFKLPPKSVGQSALVSGAHLGPITRFLLLSYICGFVKLGILSGRERVCNLQLLLGLVSAVIDGIENIAYKDSPVVTFVLSVATETCLLAVP
jgi:hypothetical protein